MISALPLSDLMSLIETIAFPTTQDNITTPGMPVGLIGRPGAGKTAFIEKLGERMGYRVEVLTLSSWTAESINGIPSKEIRKVENHAGKLVDFALCVDVAPDWQFRIFATRNQAGHRIPTLLFLDEASNVDPSVSATILRLVQSRRLPNNMKLPDDTVIILAMNSQEDSVNAFPVGVPLQNRVSWFAWEVSPQTWAAGMRNNWGTPVSREEQYWRNIVADYILDNPSELDVPSDGGVTSAVGRSKNEIREATAYAWRSGRSWDNLVRQASKFGRADFVKLGWVMTSIIGVEGAQRFMGYYRDIASTVTVEDVLNSPEVLIPQVSDMNLTARLADGVVSRVESVGTVEIARQVIRLYDVVSNKTELALFRQQLAARISGLVAAIRSIPADDVNLIGEALTVLQRGYADVVNDKM